MIKEFNTIQYCLINGCMLLFNKYKLSYNKYSKYNFYYNDNLIFMASNKFILIQEPNGDWRLSEIKKEL